MVCFSPDFTAPDPDERKRQVERQKAAIDLCVRLGTRYCRTLSGQNYPGMSREEGIERTVEGITEYRLGNGVRVLLFPDSSKETKENGNPLMKNIPGTG